MTLEGTIKNGAIVLDQPCDLGEGTRVTVTVQSTGSPESLRDVLMKYAGCMTGLPPDLAEQHDHYLHGTPKK